MSVIALFISKRIWRCQVQQHDYNCKRNQASSEYKHSLTLHVRRFVVIATKPVHQLQIRPIVHTYGAPSTIPTSCIRVRAVVWEFGEVQTDKTHRRLWPIYILPPLRLMWNVMKSCIECVSDVVRFFLREGPEKAVSRWRNGVVQWVLPLIGIRKHTELVIIPQDRTRCFTCNQKCHTAR